MILIIDSTFLLLLVFYSYKVIKLTKGNNHKLTLLMVLMVMSILSDIFKQTYLIYDSNKRLENNFYERNDTAFSYIISLP